jgi:hypothetical protein
MPLFEVLFERACARKATINVDINNKFFPEQKQAGTTQGTGRNGPGFRPPQKIKKNMKYYLSHTRFANPAWLLEDFRHTGGCASWKCWKR